MNATASNIPRHLGLILDGNRRWAKAHNLPSLEGHKRGYETLKNITRAAFEEGVAFVSAFVFSTENWRRSKEEVAYLMDLTRWVAKTEVKELDKENIRVRFLGSKDHIDEKLLATIAKAEERTAQNTKGTIALCFNYGGQQEIADACNELIAAGTQAGAVTPELLTEHLYAPDVPPVDLIIRTSGEQRLSNFMLWRAAYAECMFVPKYWPDFSEEDLKQAFAEYAARQRRFGA